MATATILAERAARMRELAESGDVSALADEVMGYIAVYDGRWGRESRDATDALTLLRPAAKADLMMAIVERAALITGAEQRRVANELLKILVKPFTSYATPDSAQIVLGFAARHSTFFDARQLKAWAEVLIDAGWPLPPEVVAMLRRTVEYRRWGHADELKPLLAKYSEPVLNAGEAWADRANADIAATLSADAACGQRWLGLVRHAATATSAQPSQKWEDRARRLVADLDDVGDRLRTWLALVGRPRTLRLNRTQYEADINEAFDPVNATTLRGLVWISAYLPEHPDNARLLGGLVEISLRKVAGLGPRNPKVANAAVYALSRIPGDAALAQIARLAARVTFKGTLKGLNSALDARAAALQLSREEVEELAIPTYDLTDVGIRVERFGDVTATFDVASATITWRAGSGKLVKAAPASVRAGYAEELKEFKAAVKDIGKMLAAQSERLDRQFLADRTWPFDAWRNRYLDHPLLGTLARRLIWLVDDEPCAFWDGQLRSLDDAAVTEGAVVRVWHPIGRDVDEVLAWRAWLEDRRITQPFKQAHREVYLLTAAEERTGVYSNRYAAHVLRQHQFHALAAVRGWRNKLRLMVDDMYEPATRVLPQWGLRAEFWVEGIGDDYSVDITESGSYLRIVTDQVRFYPIGAPDNFAHAGGGGYEQWVHQGADPTHPLPLVDIPPLVLSEVLRDVDLFVGVASVGNDPTWQDGGPEGRFREYWASYSFGELSGTAQTRRDMLDRLVPRLAIADRATVDDRFLVVRGDIRTYKIHFGSGNILMSPNDQYLCIVPKQATDPGNGTVFLPFEGDRVLAVILSKALMLAKDATITDPTITAQIRR